MTGVEASASLTGDTPSVAALSVIRQRLPRSRILAYFAKKAPCLIGMEACGSAHHWARLLTAQGHAVRLMPAAEGIGSTAELDLLALDQALEQLAAHDARAARVIVMTGFSGMRHDEVAAAIGVSIPTVERDLRFARAWLNRALAR